MPEGQWIMNPGSAGFGGTAGLILIRDGKAECRIINQKDLEEMQ